MFSSDEQARWLAAQPVGVPVAIGNESVYLRLRPGGAELGAYLWQGASVAQLHEALKQGFASAREYDAALALGPDGGALVLNQWLPRVGGWPEAAAALELLLRQLALWRGELAPRERVAPGAGGRDERRMRTLLAGGRQ